MIPAARLLLGQDAQILLVLSRREGLINQLEIKSPSCFPALTASSSRWRRHSQNASGQMTANLRDQTKREMAAVSRTGRNGANAFSPRIRPRNNDTRWSQRIRTADHGKEVSTLHRLCSCKAPPLRPEEGCDSHFLWVRACFKAYAISGRRASLS